MSTESQAFDHCVKVRPEDLLRAEQVADAMCKAIKDWLDDDGDDFEGFGILVEPPLSVAVPAFSEIEIWADREYVSPEAGALVVQALMQEFRYIQLHPTPGHKLRVLVRPGHRRRLWRRGSSCHPGRRAEMVHPCAARPAAG